MPVRKVIIISMTALATEPQCARFMCHFCAGQETTADVSSQSAVPALTLTAHKKTAAGFPWRPVKPLNARICITGPPCVTVRISAEVGTLSWHVVHIMCGSTRQSYPAAMPTRSYLSVPFHTNFRIEVAGNKREELFSNHASACCLFTRRLAIEFTIIMHVI